MKGRVYLVGGGPGDPALITVKGLDLIEKADVLVYDHLISTKLLEAAPKKAEKIYVGKQDSHHVMKQGDINKLLVEKAKEGKKVVRLKGGDPFIFGRGGEEALFLVENKVPFEVVPGVTSSVAAPTYAGIPVTHRDCNSSFMVITGHQRTSEKRVGMDWKNISDHKGTLIFLMGVHNLDEISKQLIANGRSGDTPIALIQWATWDRQKTVDGTLDTIVEKVRKENLTPPAVIVVGEVVKLREKLNWYE